VFFVFVSAGVASEEVMGQVKTFTQSIRFLKIFDFRQSEYNDGTMRDVYEPYESTMNQTSSFGGLVRAGTDLGHCA
jgi:hypothetical protein